MFHDTKGELIISEKPSDSARIRALGPFRKGNKNGLFKIYFQLYDAILKIVYTDNVPDTRAKISWHKRAKKYKGEV